jgi:phosphosulfolactate synthase
MSAQPSTPHLPIPTPRPSTRSRLLDWNGREQKPRTKGITILLDVGQLGPRAISDLLAVAADHCDYAKLAWGSALITKNLHAKLGAYREIGITPLLGGTLFEYAYLRNKVPALLDLARDYQVHVEISDGVIALPRVEKLRWISEFARHVEVFSELGGKIEAQEHDWQRAIEEELSAGSTKVVIEGREISRNQGAIREDFLEMLTDVADPDDLVFEALERRQQVALIKRFGPNVNLGNIQPPDLMTVESFRLGLKEHTLLHTWGQSGGGTP